MLGPAHLAAFLAWNSAVKVVCAKSDAKEGASGVVLGGGGGGGGGGGCGGKGGW